MQQSRKISVVSDKSAKFEIFTTAQTWGEIIPLIEEKIGSITAMRAVCKENRSDLVSDNAILPEGDILIGLTPKQIKAGNNAGQVARVFQNFIYTLESLVENLEETIQDIRDQKESLEEIAEDSRVAPKASLKADEADFLNEISRG